MMSTRGESISSRSAPGHAPAASTPNVPVRRGVYFLANDPILDITLAFLNSFRIANPDTPLCLIPYGDDFERLAAYQTVYGFTVFEDESLLSECDEIGFNFFSWRCGHFRKLCAFWGPFDEFIYIDCDTVVLQDVSFAFECLSHADFVFSHSNEAGLRRWVWKDSVYETDALSEAQIAFSANTGFFCSKRGALDLPGVRRMVPHAASMARHMELLCAEQPFLNFLVVTSGKRFTSLYSLRKARHVPDIPLERWAGPARRDAMPRGSEEIFLIHWAGVWSATPRDRKLYSMLEKLGVKVRSPSVRPFMPRKRLWNYYRHFHKQHLSTPTT